ASANMRGRVQLRHVDGMERVHGRRRLRGGRPRKANGSMRKLRLPNSSPRLQRLLRMGSMGKLGRMHAAGNVRSLGTRPNRRRAVWKLQQRNTPQVSQLHVLVWLERMVGLGNV